MGRTQISGEYIRDKSIKREDLDTSTPGNSVITRIEVEPPLFMNYTGADPGTGEVKIGLNAVQTKPSIVVARLSRNITVGNSFVTLPFQKVLFDNRGEMENGDWKSKEPGVYFISLMISLSNEPTYPRFRIIEKNQGKEIVQYRGSRYGSSIHNFSFLYVKKDDRITPLRFQFSSHRTVLVYANNTYLYIFKVYGSEAFSSGYPGIR